MRGVEAFLHLPPSVLRANRLFEETGILRSKPHSPSSSEHPTERPEKTIATWPVVVALLLAPLAPSRGTGESVHFLIAV